MRDPRYHHDNAAPVRAANSPHDGDVDLKATPSDLKTTPRTERGLPSLRRAFAHVDPQVERMALAHVDDIALGACAQPNSGKTFRELSDPSTEQLSGLQIACAWSLLRRGIGR